RPSSAPGAKASTVCHYHLATTDNKMLAHTIHKSKNPPHTPTPHRNQALHPARPTPREFSKQWHQRKPTPTPPGEGLLPQTPNSAPPPATTQATTREKSDCPSS